MKVSKNKVSLLAAAVATLFSVGAQAQATVTLPSLNPTVAATVALPYAREISAGVAIGTAGYNVRSILGIGTSNTQNRFYRVRLNNATFAVPVVAANFAGFAGAAQLPSVAAANFSTSVSQGGTVGSNFVIFQITAGADINVNDGIQFQIPAGGVTIASTAAAASVTMEVYEFIAAAQAQTPVLYTATANLATFSPAVNLRAVAQQNQTATAISSYLNLTGGASTALSARVAQLDLAGPALTAANACGGAFATLRLTEGLPFSPNGTTCAFVSTVVNANLSNVLTMNGDFSAAASAASVTLGANPASAVSATGATVNLTAAQAAGFTATNVTYTVNGTTAIPVSTYTASFVGTANTGYTLASIGPTTTGSIGRDGVQYESPWVTATTGFISRFFLTQTTPASVPYTVIVRNAAGLVTGGTLTGTLGANRQTLVTMSSLLPADTTAFPGPYQVTFNIASDASVTMGSYVLTSPNGSVANSPLYRATNR